MANTDWLDADCPVRRGDLVAGKYRIERVLGAGGMGIVIAATQVHLARPVALKFLLPRTLQRPDHVARFAREARAVARLESEHVARVLDVGTLEGGAPYIVMEYLEGEDLGRVLAKRGRLLCADAVSYVLQASEAVAEAHALGIVHRDLKPANLFLARRSNGRSIVKVLDFGLSKFSAANDHVTSESSILGSPLYMSPEQLMSPLKAEARSDIWSLGVTLYELLAGCPPFSAEKMAPLVAGILHGQEPRLSSLRPDLPEGLCVGVHRCLEKDPANRFADVADFADALAPYAPASQRANSLATIAHLVAGTGAGTPSDGSPTPAPAEQGVAGPPGREPLSLAPPSRVVASPSARSPSAIAMGSARAQRPWRRLGAITGFAVAAMMGLAAVSRMIPHGPEGSGEWPPRAVPRAGEAIAAPSPPETAFFRPRSGGAGDVPSPVSTTPIEPPLPSAPSASPANGKRGSPDPPAVSRRFPAPAPAPTASATVVASSAPSSSPPAIDPLSRLKAF